ncbi:MAG: metalloregulator ArsR/SmtB family transcription factor [Bacteroidota bacterium]
MKKVDDSIKKKSEIIKALAHPARLEILLLLSRKKGKMSVTDIHESLGLTQPETSRHLIVLKNGSVLNSEKKGANSFYFINDEHSFIRCIANCMNKLKDEQ